MDRVFAALLAAALICSCSSVFAAEKAPEGGSGAALFQWNCAPCHPEGGNILNPQKTLRKKDLDANNITTAADIIKKMRNPGPFPTHPQDWAGMRMFDERTISDRDAHAIADYILSTFH